jgi:hypothetical protein
MINTIIKEASSYLTIESFERLLITVPPERIVNVKLSFEKAIGLPYNKCPMEKYSLIFYTDMNHTIHLHSSNTNNDLEFRNDMFKLLKLAGF